MAAKLNLSLVIIAITVYSSNSLAVPDLTDLNIDQVLVNIFNRIFESASNITTSSGNERKMNCIEQIQYHGFKAEQHTVVSNGYIIDIVRSPRNSCVVLLVPGLASSCHAFLTSGNDSLFFRLAREGYDVWCLNPRGNEYSKQHLNLSSNDPEFWKFSFHEMACQDLAKVIDYIIDWTGQKKLAYIGHSRGTTMPLILLSLKTEYNEKLSVVICLAPIAYIWNMHSPLVRTILSNGELLQTALIACGVNQFLPKTRFTDVLITDVACSSTLTALAIDIFLFLIWGISFAQILFKCLVDQIAHFISGSSVWEFFHFAQLYLSKCFRPFDYGKFINMQTYNLSSPPPYPVEKITCLFNFIYSLNDGLSAPVDVQSLAARMPNVGDRYLVPASFNHNDYNWGRDAPSLVYSKIIEYLETVKCYGSVATTTMTTSRSNLFGVPLW